MDVTRINDYLTYFYSGRYPDHKEFDLRLGGGGYVMHEGAHAIVFDTFGLPGQGKWVKDYMISTHGIERFTVVNTHWQPDFGRQSGPVGHGNIDVFDNADFMGQVVVIIHWRSLFDCVF